MSDLDKQLDEPIKKSKECILNTSEERRAIRALLEVGIYIKDINMGFLSNNFRSKITKAVDEFLELGNIKDHIANFYFRGASEEMFSEVDFTKIYEQAKKDLLEIGDDTLRLIILGRTYAIHKYYEKYETPKARVAYYKVMEQ